MYKFSPSSDALDSKEGATPLKERTRKTVMRLDTDQPRPAFSVSNIIDDGTDATPTSP